MLNKVSKKCTTEGEDYMPSEEIEKVVYGTICEQFSVRREQIGPNFRVEDLGADSLDLVELSMEFEDELDINIPNEDYGSKLFFKNATIKDVCRYLDRRLEEAGR